MKVICCDMCGKKVKNWCEVSFRRMNITDENINQLIPPEFKTELCAECAIKLKEIIQKK